MIKMMINARNYDTVLTPRLTQVQLFIDTANAKKSNFQLQNYMNWYLSSEKRCPIFISEENRPKFYDHRSLS